VFLRSFEGRIEDPTYFDLLQKLTHAFDLHFVPERNAYCRFDERGDFDDVISIHISDTSHAKERRNLRVVQIDRRVLDEYLTITETAYIRLFDSTRYAAGQFSHWDQARERVEDSTAQLYYTFGKAGHDASYIRGFQVISSPLTADQVIKRMHGGDEDKQYETFLAHDFKHKRIAECSCDPRKLGSYFDESDLPFQMSPAFFSPDVLARYKADTDKYKLCDRSIICRGGWVLEHYDVNEAGQVHTYLKDLGGLPYEEQRYWKSRNERPKGPISERAYKSHFLGEWYEDDDPLRELRELLAQLAKARAPWWTLKSENLLEKAHYPVTEAADEWAREIGTLDKLLSEGLEVGELRRRAKGLGRTVDSTWRSLKLAEEVLLGLGHDAQEAKQALAPLREVCDLRSTTTGTHVTGEKAKAKKAAIVKEHGTFQAHYRSLCRRCVMSMLRLREVFSAE
jgi:hypothetical protein